MDSITFAEVDPAEAERAQKLFDESMAAMAKAKQELAKVAQSSFSVGLRKVFEKHPEVDSFGWQQYTPYFNDGDTCTFSVNSYSDSIEVNGESPSYGHDDISDTLKARYEEAAEEFSSFLGQFDDDTMLNMFGDHVTVTVTPTGAKMSECSHD